MGPFRGQRFCTQILDDLFKFVAWPFASRSPRTSYNIRSLTPSHSTRHPLRVPSASLRGTQSSILKCPTRKFREFDGFALSASRLCAPYPYQNVLFSSN